MEANSRQHELEKVKVHTASKQNIHPMLYELWVSITDASQMGQCLFFLD